MLAMQDSYSRLGVIVCGMVVTTLTARPVGINLRLRCKRSYKGIWPPSWHYCKRNMIASALNSTQLPKAGQFPIWTARSASDRCRHRPKSSCGLSRVVGIDTVLLRGEDEVLRDSPIPWVVWSEIPAHLRLKSGGRGIRTPGELPHNGFQDRRLKPLGHPSLAFPARKFSFITSK